MQHTLLTMSLAGPVEYVKCATRCLMAVSCMLQGVKITKAGSFSPTSHCCILLEVIYNHSSCDREVGGVERMRRQNKQDHKKFKVGRQ